jgi:hypothetical protein
MTDADSWTRSRSKSAAVNGRGYKSYEIRLIVSLLARDRQ